MANFMDLIRQTKAENQRRAAQPPMIDPSTGDTGIGIGGPNRAEPADPGAPPRLPNETDAQYKARTSKVVFSKTGQQ